MQNRRSFFGMMTAFFGACFVGKNAKGTMPEWSAQLENSPGIDDAVYFGIFNGYFLSAHVKYRQDIPGWVDFIFREERRFQCGLKVWQVLKILDDSEPTQGSHVRTLHRVNGDYEGELVVSIYGCPMWEKVEKSAPPR